MPKQPPFDNPEVLWFKLECLEKYIAHYEWLFDTVSGKIAIEFEKTCTCYTATGRVQFIGCLKHVVDDNWRSAPSHSLIEADLAEARAEINATDYALPAWVEIKRKLIKFGFSKRLIEAGFESAIVCSNIQINNPLCIIIRRKPSVQDSDKWVCDFRAA